MRKLGASFLQNGQLKSKYSTTTTSGLVAPSADTPGASIMRFCTPSEINDGVWAKEATATDTMAAPRRATTPWIGARWFISFTLLILNTELDAKIQRFIAWPATGNRVFLRAQTTNGAGELSDSPRL